MLLNESDLIASLLRNQSYVDQIIPEMIPDDTQDLVKQRKGKGGCDQLDHIVGISNLQAR